jgi:hypothetical protein
MFRITLDKIASATKNAGIEAEAYVTEDIVSEEGCVIAVRIVSDKVVYNSLENVHGRMMRLKPGDQIAGVLGSRRGLYGYSGGVPESLAPGDRVHVLNAGGVLGRCTSHAPDVGEPFEAEVIGAVLSFPVLGERIGEPARIGRGPLPDVTAIHGSAPIIAVVGTSMRSGKTVAACQVIHGLSKRGLEVAGAKVTGVALERDVLSMRDHGASPVLSFNDAGLVSTNTRTAPLAARRIVAELNRAKPDAIVLELGDGLLGEYGVQAILADDGIMRHVAAVVLSANDPVGALGAKGLLRTEYGRDITLVTGPVTDNEVGISYIESELHIPARNALVAPQALAGQMLEEVFDK